MNYLNRDSFVALLKMLVTGWAYEHGLAKSHRKIELEVLIAKTEAFLRDEFGE